MSRFSLLASKKSRKAPTITSSSGGSVHNGHSLDHAESDFDPHSERLCEDDIARPLEKAWSPSFDYSQSALRPEREVVDDDEISSDDGDALQAELPQRGGDPAPPRRYPEPQTTLNPIAGQNLFDEGGNTKILVLAPSDQFCFFGTVSMTVLLGTVDVCGVYLTPSPTTYHLFAPATFPLPVVRALRVTRDGEMAQEMAPSLVERLQCSLNPLDTVVRLEPLRSGVEGLETIVPRFRGMFLPNGTEGQQSEAWGIYGFHPVTRPEGQLYAFAFPSGWRQAVEQALESLRGTTNGLAPLVALIKGPRKVGKSTFSRILLNRLTRVYRQVAYLECDLGQAEFSPSGMVSLHVIKRPIFGPPFSHLQWPIAAHYIGSDSPRSSPHHYISAIAALLQTHKSDIQYAPFEGAEDLVDKRNHSMTPLVINTSGWTRGMGGDLLRQIQELARPTHIFDIDGQRGPGHEELGPGDRTSLQEIEGATVWTDESFLPRSFNSSCSQAAVYRLRPFNPPPSARVPSPAELRALCIMSYFYGRPSDEGMTWRVNRSLVAIPPYQVDVTVAFDAVILTGSGAEDVVVEEVLRTLACSIVGLVESTAQGDSSRTSGFPYIQGRGPPDPWTSRCLGLGFIRGISSSAESTGVCIHLLTPLPPSVFRRCRVMVKGELEMPIWAFMDRSEEERPNGWGVMPYLTHNSGAAAVGSKTKTRKNVLQRGYR